MRRQPALMAPGREPCLPALPACVPNLGDLHLFEAPEPLRTPGPPTAAVNAWGANIGAAKYDLSLPLLDPNRAFALIASLLNTGDDNHLFIAAAGNDQQRLVPPGLLDTLLGTNPYNFLPAQLNVDNILVVGASGVCVGAGGWGGGGTLWSRSARA